MNICQPMNLEAKQLKTNKTDIIRICYHYNLNNELYEDHDSDEKNEGRNNSDKVISKDEYLDSINEPKNSSLRVQNSIYQSFYLDTHQKILVILVDVKYEAFEDTGDILGDEQWEWLEKQLQKQAELTILGSGVQVMPDDRFDGNAWFKESQFRLYDLIQKYHSTSNSRYELVIFISGKPAYSELLRHPCPERFGQDIFELTISRLEFPGDIGIGNIYYDFHYPTTFNIKRTLYDSSNFGILKIDVSETGSPLKVIYELHKTTDSKLNLRQEIQISEIKYDPNRVNLESQCILDIPAKQRYKNRTIEAVRKNCLNLTMLCGCFIWIIIEVILKLEQSLCNRFKIQF